MIFKYLSLIFLTFLLIIVLIKEKKYKTYFSLTISGYFLYFVMHIIAFHFFEGIPDYLYFSKYGLLGFSAFMFLAIVSRVLDKDNSEYVSKKRRRIESRLPVVGFLIFYAAAQRLSIPAVYIVFIISHIVGLLLIIRYLMKTKIRLRELL